MSRQKFSDGKAAHYIFTFFGIIMVAFAFSTCYLPNKIVSGGVSGVSTILYHTFSVEPGISNVVINVLLLLLGLKVLGKEFIIKTLLNIVVLSAFTQIFMYLPPLTENILLASVFGSVLYGFGIGITLAFGSSSGGTDIVSRIIQHRFAHISIGRLLMVIDGAVILSSLIVFKETDAALYGVISLFISTYAIDLFIKKLNISKLAFVVTDKGEEIAQKLVNTSPRGITVIDAVGAYTHEKRKMLVCALKQNEITSFQNKIIQIDPNAFIIFSESQQIVGNGFYVYK